MFIITNPQPHLSTVAAALCFNVGSAYERQARDSGLSHFLEHMVFRGSNLFPNPHDFELAVESIGGDMNAWTSVEQTCFHIEAPKENAEYAIDLLLSVFDRPKFEGIESERAVVMEEENASVNGIRRKYSCVRSLLEHQLHGDNYVKTQPVLGKPETIAAFSVDDLHRHFATYYGTDNAVLSIAGAIDHKYRPQSAHLRRGTWHSTIDPSYHRASSVEFTAGDSKSDSVFVELGFTVPGTSDHRFPAVEVLCNLLGGGMTAKLIRTIRDYGLAYDVGCDIEPGANSSAFILKAVTTAGKAARVARTMASIVKAIPFNISSDELQLAMNKAKWEAIGLSDSALHTAQTFGCAYLGDFNTDPYRCNVVTLDDLAALVKVPMHIAVMGNVDAETRKKIEDIELPSIEAAA